jgi:acyl-CoA thioesterase-1
MRKLLFCIFIGLASAAHADTKVVAALGDSLTAGYGLPQGEGFVPQLQGWLEARGHDVQIVNAGVSGDTTQGGAARLDWTLTDDVDAVIVELGGNDLLRALDPSLTRANMEAIADSITARGLPLLIAGFEAPGNYGPEYKAEFDAVYPDVAAQSGAVYHPSFLGPITALGLEDGREMMQADGIHPNAQGVALIVEDIGPAVEELLARIE